MVNAFSEQLALSLYGRSTQECIDMQCCVKCGGDAFIFDDFPSKKEFKISGLCQSCQDDIFCEVDEDA